MWLKLLIIGGILYALYRLAGGTILPERKEKGPKSSEEPEEGETLVECDRCSTYVVKKEAVLFRGKYYCSTECLPET